METMPAIFNDNYATSTEPNGNYADSNYLMKNILTVPNESYSDQMYLIKTMLIACCLIETAHIRALHSYYGNSVSFGPCCK